MKKTLTFAVLLTALPLGSNLEAAEPIAGSPDAKAQLTIYGDIQSPFTRKLMTYLDRFEAEYGNRIGIQFSQFPLSFHPQAKPAAVAALCANRQGELPAFLKAAFANQARLGRDFYRQTAKDVGVRDLKGFSECLDDKQMESAVDAEFEAGEKATVNSTPTMSIGGELVRGVYPYEEYETRINKLLDQKE